MADVWLENIILEPFLDLDIGIMEKWFQKEYIKKWYGNTNEWIVELENRNGEYNFIKHFMVKHQNHKIGFCQYYDCYYAQEGWYKIDLPKNTYSIDYLIGEEEYLNKGIGKEIIKQLIDKIKLENGKEIIVHPELENEKSCKALVGNGFLYNEKRKYYYKFCD
jgi:RimJ/RimL family protein N-acetyltransferase